MFEQEMVGLQEKMHATETDATQRVKVLSVSHF